MLMVGDLRVIPHLVVCGLFNHYTHGARHISVGCLDLLLIAGYSALMVPSSLSVLFPLRLDSAIAYNLLVIPLGLSPRRLPHLLLQRLFGDKYFPPFF